MKKKVISVFMCMCMVFSMYIPVGITASAENDKDSQPNTNMPQEVDGLEIKKTVGSIPNNDGSYNVKLEAYSKGTVTTTTTTIPSDIVLVLDVSGSMDWDMAGNETDNNSNKRIKALKTAVGNFINSVYLKSLGSDPDDPSDDIDNRIAIVKFAGENNDSTGNDMYYNEYYNYSQKVKSLTSVKTAENKNHLIDAVNALTPGGATRSDLGMEHAKDIIFNANKDTSRKSTKTVIMFTDGEPTLIGSDFNDNVANEAISVSGYIKKDLCATVYTIGIMSGANNLRLPELPENPVQPPEPDGKPLEPKMVWFWDDWEIYWVYKDVQYGKEQDAFKAYNGDLSAYENSDAYKKYSQGFKKYEKDKAEYDKAIELLYEQRGKVNPYMQLVSSNFKNATNLDNPGAPTYPESGSYYLTATDSAQLDNIFMTISNLITSPNIELDETAVVKDVVSEYFHLPEGVEKDDIGVYTSAYNGETDTWDEETKFTDANVDLSKSAIGEITVSNFDFDANCVTSSPKSTGSNDYGKKIVIKFKIKPNQDFIGGNYIPTNDAASGVYLGDTLVENFDIPHVNIGIKYKFATKNQSIYLSQTANLNEIIDADIDSKTHIPKTTPVDGINNSFVDIVYTLKDENNNLIGTYKVSHGEDTGSWVWKAGENGGSIAPNISEKYTLLCKVSPIESPSGGVLAWKDSKYAYIYVFRPTIKVGEDTMVNYRTQVNLNKFVSVKEWKCAYPEGWDGGTASEPSSNRPILTFEFSDMIDETNTIKDKNEHEMLKDTDFEVVKVIANGGKDIKDYILFYNNDRQFNIALNRFDLTIDKTVVGNVIDQPFVINVESNIDGEGKKVYPITILPTDFSNNKARKTIKGLYCGVDYTVTEDANWSWRFEPQESSPTVRSDANGDIKRVDIVNSRTKTKWFSGDAIARNEGKQSVWDRVANTVLPIVS